MTHISEVIDTIRKQIQFGFCYHEAQRCRRLWKAYKARPNMFTAAEWHESLLRWNQYVAEYEHGTTAS